jgi:hypothetical protein
MNATKVARKLRIRMGRFSGDLSEGLCVAAKRFVSQMVYGIQAAESVLLTEIGRTLEEGIALDKTEERLSRNLQRTELEATVQENLLKMAASRVGDDTLLIVDPSDLSKKYAKKMEYLATVRDGSAHDLAQGYWTLHIAGCGLDTDGMVPLYQRLWSAQAPDFSSENDEILRGIDAVATHVGRRGLWIMDRGGDRINLFSPILDRKLRFVFRLVGNRNLIRAGQTMLAAQVALGCPVWHSKPIVRIEDGEEKIHVLRFGFRRVRLPEREEPLCLLVVHGLGAEPLMLLTNEPLNRSFKCLWRMVRAYLKRWSIEETIRYAKTCYDLENVRVLNYQGLQNLMPLVLAAMYFAACVLDHDQRLRVMAAFVEKAAKRLFGIADFKYYALADGMRALFARHPGAPVMRTSPQSPRQMTLFALDSP